MKHSHENQSPDNSSNEKPESAHPERDDNGFLGRWSRRKHEVEVVEPGITDDLLADQSDANIQPLESGQLPTQVEETVALTDADMPDIETLNADSDYSPFFSDGVSKELRNLALKKLFFSGKFAARDGLDDYDDDFTKFEPLGDTVTSDMKYHARRKEKARLAELEEQKLLQENTSDDEVAEENQPVVASEEEITEQVAKVDQSEIASQESDQDLPVADESDAQTHPVKDAEEKPNSTVSEVVEDLEGVNQTLKG